jgi:hypothetical protein
MARQQEGWFACKIAYGAFLKIASARNATGRRSSVAPVNAMLSHSGRLTRHPLTVMRRLSWASEEMLCGRSAPVVRESWLLVHILAHSFQPCFRTMAAKPKK